MIVISATYQIFLVLLMAHGRTASFALWKSGMTMSLVDYSLWAAKSRTHMIRFGPGNAPGVKMGHCWEEDWRTRRALCHTLLLLTTGMSHTWRRLPQPGSQGENETKYSPQLARSGLNKQYIQLYWFKPWRSAGWLLEQHNLVHPNKPS